MNSMIGRSGLAAATLCGLLLAGCDSVKDVRDEPFTAIPPQKAVLIGTISGLGSARPVALSYNGAPNCFAADPANPSAFIPADCRFYGVAGQSDSDFSFGSLDVGTPYSIAVVTQPYGKTCTVANATGTVGAGAAVPVVTCENNVAAVPRHDLTVNIAPALQALPDLKVRLETEEELQVVDATGLPSISFPQVLFNSGTSLPSFTFKLIATTDTTDDGQTTANRCTFTQTSSFSEGGTNINATGNAFTPRTDAVVVPTGPVSVTLNACTFTVSAAVQYNGTPALTMPGGGMTLALRNHFTGVDEQTLEVNAFTAGTASVAFATPVRAHAKAQYELVVARQPAGMHCVVAGSTIVVADTTSATAGLTVPITAPTASAVLLVEPLLSDWWAYANRQVRCRALPAVQNQLVGTYQMDVREGMQATDPPRAYGRPREFLTFFADGTFLFGINMNSASASANSPNATFPSTASLVIRNNYAASSGVTHGFYAYNSVAGTITFTVFTATSINAAGRGITGMPGYTSVNTNGPGFIIALATGTVTATNVQKSSAGGLGTLSLTFTSGANTRLWTMTEPESIPGELTGTWVTADHRRMFAYHGGQTYAFHIGVNGLGNLQDTCLLPTDASTQSGGVITRHSGSATNENFVYTCTPGIINPGTAFVFARNADYPHYALKNSTPSGLGIGPTTPRAVPGYVGRFPGTATQLDQRPTSPVLFTVTSGMPDTLVLQDTLNGTPIGQPITFLRHRAE